MRRTVFFLTALLAGCIAAFAPISAQAAECGVDPDSGGPLPLITHPCPGPGWQPVSQPVAVVTDDGPGYYNYYLRWIRVTQGGRVFFANEDLVPHRYFGEGFDSGDVQPGEVKEVAGISSLRVGQYTVYSAPNVSTGALYIDPNPVEPIT